MPDTLLASKGSTPPKKPEPSKRSQMIALLPTTLRTSHTSPSLLGYSIGYSIGCSSDLVLGAWGSRGQADHVGQAKGEPRREYPNGNANDPRLPTKMGPKFQAYSAPDFHKTAGILPEVHL